MEELKGEQKKKKKKKKNEGSDDFWIPRRGRQVLFISQWSISLIESLFWPYSLSYKNWEFYLKCRQKEKKKKTML